MGIPNSFFSLRKMLYLYLNNNNLGGTLPAYWGREYESLSVAWLHDNNFIGSVPKEWGTLKYLVELSLQNNNIEGSIQIQFATLAQQPMRLVLNGSWKRIVWQVLMRHLQSSVFAARYVVTARSAMYMVLGVKICSS